MTASRWPWFIVLRLHPCRDGKFGSAISIFSRLSRNYHRASTTQQQVRSGAELWTLSLDHVLPMSLLRRVALPPEVTCLDRRKPSWLFGTGARLSRPTSSPSLSIARSRAGACLACIQECRQMTSEGRILAVPMVKATAEQGYLPGRESAGACREAHADAEESSA